MICDTGVPLAVGITPSESVDALTKLFRLVKRVLPDNSFHHRGRDQGPQLFMTDDSAAEQEALHNVWPELVTLSFCFYGGFRNLKKYLH